MNDTDLVNILIIFFCFPLVMSLGFKWTFLVMFKSLKVVLVQTEIAYVVIQSFTAVMVEVNTAREYSYTYGMTTSRRVVCQKTCGQDILDKQN